MGGMLSEPETEKKTHHGEGLGLRYGISSMQGWRPEMEDAHDVKIGLKYGLDNWSFFAVFDGHAGKNTALYASELLLEYILRPEGYEKIPDPKQDNTDGLDPKPDENIEASFISSPISPDQLLMVENAIKSGFLRIDQSMRVAAQDASGCTAVCALISPTHIFIANCGDSRAVFYSSDNMSFVTEDHKPFHPIERKRITDAGGVATQRINGTLAVSRALGDFEFKKDNLRGPCEQLVSPEPEVTIIKRNPKHDEFLVLACDGIWDVMDNYDLCQFIRYQLLIEPDLEKICSSVLDLCLNKGSRDNMSIIIVLFETAPTVQELEIERDKQNDQELIEYIDRRLDKFNGTNDFEIFFDRMKSELRGNSSIFLPPGAGLEAKHDLLRQRFELSINKKPDLV